MRRVLVVGMSGAGKTTAAQQISRRSDLPFHEMDGLAYGPGWTTRASFVADVDRVIGQPRWVFDSWGYEAVRDRMWKSADTVIWLDYPFRIVMTRLVRRSIVRTVSRRRLFGGNRETLLGWLNRDHPVWHAVSTFGTRRDEVARRANPDAAPHLTMVHLRHPADLDRWLSALPTMGTCAES